MNPCMTWSLPKGFVARLLCPALAGPFMLSACNAVLGIEPAELVQGTGGASDLATGGAGGKPSVASGGVSSAPTAKPPCTQCLADKCPSVDACLGDNTCRYKLAIFASCLAKDSTDVGCLEALPPELSNCVGGNCSTECAGSALASPCALYCACMGDQCSAPPLSDCATTCGNLSFAKAGCRFTHCQLAVGSMMELHCKHARADPGADRCAEVESANPCTAGPNPTGAPRGGGCSVATDCCYGDCDTMGGFCR